MSPRTEAFDPYSAWLGIGPEERPLDHYRLLGLPRFEADTNRILAAADERMIAVRKYQHGPRSAFSQRLLNELAAARVCLLDPTSKKSYDAWLTAMAPRAAPVARVLGISPAVPPLPPSINAVSPVAPPRRDVKQADVETSPGTKRLAAIFGSIILLLAVAALWPYFSGRRTQPLADSRPPEIAPAVDETRRDEPPKVSRDPLDKAVVIQQEADGGVNFSPATAVLEGNVELAVAGSEYVLVNWSSPEDRIRWRFRLLEPAVFTVELTYVIDGKSVGSQLALQIDDDDRKAVTTRMLGVIKESVTDTFFLKVASNGEHVLTLQGLEKPGPEYCILQSIRISPGVPDKPSAERDSPSGANDRAP